MNRYIVTLDIKTPATIHPDFLASLAKVQFAGLAEYTDAQVVVKAAEAHRAADPYAEAFGVGIEPREATR